MPISGSAVHRQLMDLYAQGQTRLNEVRGSTPCTQAQRDELNHTRDDALLTLAEYYLPELTHDAIRRTWGDVRGGVSEVLSLKEEHQRRLQETLEELSTQRLAVENELVQLNERLDQAQASQERVSGQVESELRKDPNFVQLSDRAAVAEAALERAEANFAEIDQDAARKLPAFNESVLFRYLYDQGFGTNRYNQRGFTRRADRYLASFINYRKARESYEFLRKTPEQMRTIIDEDRGALNIVMDELERLRDRVATEHGLPSVIEQLRELSQEREQLLERLNKLQVETEQVGHELSDLEQTKGPYYREAIQRFRGMLARLSSSELRQRADDTADITDDQIVARILGVETDMKQLDHAAEQRDQQISQMQAMVDALGRLIQQFRVAGYDSAQAQFADTLDIAGRLYRAQQDQDIDNLWEELRRSHRRGPSTIDKISNVATHPMTQVLVNAMAHAAAGALTEHARRAGHRRGRRYGRF